MQNFPLGTALIFGGSGGIGRGIARCFAEAGTPVAISYRSKADEAEAVADLCRSYGVRASIHRVDVRDADHIAAMLRNVIAEHGRIHTMVWGAGPLVNQRYIAAMPLKEWREAFDIEVHGFFAAATQLIPHMREMGGGSFVTLGSAGHDWWPSRDGLSVAVKASNEQLVKGIAKEEGKYGIRANSVLVGVIDAGQFQKLRDLGQIDDRWIEATYKLSCLKFLGTPDDIGHACVFLASDKARFVTGQSLSVSGGFGV